MHELLREYVSLVLEGRVADAQKSNSIDADTMGFLIQGQPTGSRNKYLAWCTKQVSDGFDPSEVIATVNDFDALRPNAKKISRDINSYKTLEDLKFSIKRHKAHVELAALKAHEEEKTDIVYDDERFFVIRPHTPLAASKYGKGTKWCFNMSNDDDSHFPSHAEGGSRIFYIIDRAARPRSKYSKIAIDSCDTDYAHLTDNKGTDYIQAWDASNTPIELGLVAKALGHKWETILNAIRQNIEDNPRPENWELNS